MARKRSRCLSVRLTSMPPESFRWLIVCSLAANQLSPATPPGAVFGTGHMLRIPIPSGLSRLTGMTLGQPAALVQAGLKFGSAVFDDATNCVFVVGSMICLGVE